jgi:hypothetical protein
MAREKFSQPSQACGRALECHELLLSTVRSLATSLGRLRVFFPWFSKSWSSKVSAFQTSTSSFGVMKGFSPPSTQISLSSMPKFRNLKAFFSLCIKSDVGLKIMCQDLDFQTLFALGLPKFGAEH